MTLEALLPTLIAVIIECQTDSKVRTLTAIRILIKDFGGTVAPTTHLFERRGKIILENPEGMGEEKILDAVIEAGAIDVEVREGGNVLVWTEPSQTIATAQALSQSLGLKVEDSDIVWEPKAETMVDMDPTDNLTEFLNRLHDDPCVQGVYLNAS